MRALIVDDERPARMRLKSLLAGVPGIEVVGEAENGETAVRLIEEHLPEVVFLDVQMPILDGFEVIERLSYLPQIVFVTAWDQYAIRAFEVNAVDYLLKPYSRERVLRSLERAAQNVRANADTRGKLLDVLRYYRDSDTRLLRITVRDGGCYHVLDLAAVDFFRSDGGLVFLHAGAREFLVNRPLQDLEDALDPKRFLRVHRNAIANLSRVVTVNPGMNGSYLLRFPGGEQLKVSRDRVPRLKSLIGLSRVRRIRSTQ